MPFARIWYEPTGVKITYFVDGADIGHVESVLRQDGHVHRSATFEDVESRSALDALLPPDRSQRYKWRKALIGRGVRVDPTVPDLQVIPIIR